LKTNFDLRSGRLIQPPGLQFVFVPAEIVAELMQVCDANLVAVNRQIAFREVVDVFQKKQDLRGHRIRITRRGSMWIADEHAEDVGLKLIAQDRLARPVVEADRKRPRFFAQLRRQRALSGRNDSSAFLRRLVQSPPSN
jgi:hypothetical protein